MDTCLAATKYAFCLNLLQTSDSAEKVIMPPEPEPAGAGQKGKEGSSKDKKVAAEGNRQKSNKQDAKEPAQCAEPAVVEVNSLQNGDKSQKRPEKRRQSLGGFFKGLVGGLCDSSFWDLGPEVWCPPARRDWLGHRSHKY